MIRIYDKEERWFNHLGLGSLDESISAVVVEELNGGYEMEMEYPITGRHFDKIQHRNIIFCKPNMYSDPQPFRIYSITKPINGIVIINAEHISYDANGVTILPKRDSETKTIESFGDKVTVDDKEGYYLDTILRDINLSSAIQDKNRFEVSKGSDKENVFKEEGYKIPAPLNLRSMLGGMSGSILEQFKGEYEFDRYNIILHNKRGVNRGITIRYGKNMTDLEHESEANQLFTAIFPFYSKSYTETQTSTKPVFQDTYIIEGVTPRRADWLSIELLDVSKKIGGISLKPVVELMKVLVDGVEDLVERYAPVIVKTPDDPEGTDEFYDKIYVFKRNKVDTENPELTNLFEVYVSQKHTETIIINEEEKTIEVIDEIKLNKEDVNPIVPEFGNIYIVKSDNSEHYNRNIIWDNGQFMEYSSDGFYVEAKDATLVDTLKDLKPIPTYPIRWDEVNSKWIRDDQNGSIYVEPKKPYVGTISVDKYVYLDLLEYDLPDGSITLLENGVIYVNEELKNLDNQKVLTLDMTEALDSIGGLEPTEMTQEHLFDKAEQYLKDNDLTKMKESVTISFIKLSDSPEYAHLKQLEIVELGDEINVIYEDLGVNSIHRVISTEYNVLTDSYNEIELGDKASKITNNVVSVGDNISSLKNDEEFANKTYVVDFVAENAKIINAEIQNAIIKTLEAAHVNISNSLTASSATIDQLVAEMLVSENAKISELLEAGSVRVKGDVTINKGSIKIGGTPESPNFEVDTLGNVTIVSGEIELGRDLPIIDAIIIGGTDFSANWLESPTEGPILPSTDKAYRVLNDGEYFNMLFRWNALISKYEPYTLGYFHVNDKGDVVAKSIEIIDGNITSGTINVGDGNFIVDKNGKAVLGEVVLNALGIGGSVTIGGDGILRAENVEISGSIESDTIEVQEISIPYEGGDIKIKASDESTTTSGSYNVNTWITVQDNLTHLEITANANASNVLPSSRSVTVYVSYYGEDENGAFDVFNIQIIVTIPEGSSSGSSSYIVNYSGTPPGNVRKIGQSPSSFTFYTTTGTTNLGVSKNFVPLTDDDLDLGSSQKRWDNIYATNTSIISTSDRRQKKAINYDISLYEALFDKLKPASYKFINGKSGRTHMGFISQDIRDALDELGISTEDFAGFVKTLLNSSKEKAPEDLTEEDYSYGIRYGELHALQVQQIQLLKKQVKELSDKVIALENKLGDS